MTTEFFLALHTKTKDNQRVHWSSRAKSTKIEREAAFWSAKEAGLPPFPVRVTITRTGPRKLDVTNLGSAFKAIIDGIADAYQIDDKDERWEFVFKQEKKPIYGVNVKLESISG